MVEAQFLFEHVSDPIIVVDREFRVIRVNPSFCNVFGVTEKQFLGKKSCDVFKELDFSQCNEACMRVVRKEVEGGKWAEVPDEHCPHFDYVYPIFDEQGRLREAMLMLKSTHPERFSREPHTSAERTENRDETLSSIYHDLASPLQVIRACTDVMALELEENSAATNDLMRDMLEAARRNERRLYEMVRTIRMVPQLEEEDSLDQEPVNVKELIESICADFRLILRDDVTLEWEVPAHIPQVMADPNLLSRVFFNLLDNAARYTRQGGRIAVAAECKPADTHVTFTVFDEGDVIPPEFQHHLFQKNLVFDLKSGSMKTRRDHGWGLYFCRLTVERFGGSIKVESHEGWGTRFTFTLPVAPRA